MREHAYLATLPLRASPNHAASGRTPANDPVSYMSFQGNPVRLGKLTMESADLTVLNLDSGDALDWSQDHYRDQLVAGYSKVTPNFGLRAYAKDFSKLPHAPATRAPATAKN